MSKTYYIHREGDQKTDGVTVMVQEGIDSAYILDPKQSQAVRNHSPDGFNFGYGGSGPAQLALAILLDYIGKPPHAALYQAFKFKFIGSMPEPGGVITAGQIEDFCQQYDAGNEGWGGLGG